MEKFEVHILGCGSALPTMRHNPSSQVVNVRNKLFMIDCGEGTQLQLRRSRLPFTRINHVFVSHLHGDHCFGLVGMISTFGMLHRNGPLFIHSHERLQELLQPQLDFFCSDIGYEVVFEPFNPFEEMVVYDDRSVTVSTIPLSHRIPTCGFLFREKPTRSMQEQGLADTVRSYAYCSDTCYQPQLSERVKGVSMLYHEATFSETEQLRAKQTFHSTARQAAQVAKDACARHLVIGHFSSRYDDETQILREAQEVFPTAELARENMKIEIL